jgi:hypothetical protein
MARIQHYRDARIEAMSVSGMPLLEELTGLPNSFCRICRWSARRRLA